MNWNEDFEKSVYDRIYDLDKDQLFKLAKGNIDVGSVHRGLIKRTFFIEGGGLRIKLFYIADAQKVSGYYLDYEFKQEDCFEVIFLYCFFIAGEYRFENPIKLYNGYLHTIRQYLESINIQTITISEVRHAERTLSREGLPFRAIILKDYQEIEFYRELFDFNYHSFKRIEGQKYVYLLFNERNGYFKIGYSKNPLKREKTLQAEEPNVTLLKMWDKDMSFEKALHKQYFRQRIRGEWFEFTFQELWELKEL